MIPHKQSELLETCWGTLLVMDAMRFDIFSELVKELDFKGYLKKADSQALGTAAWYYRHWIGIPGQIDITLIAANPWGLRYSLKFERIIRAWDGGADCMKVDPDRTMNFYRKYASGKRAMIHFVPPHQPFITKKGIALYKKMKIEISKLGGTDWDDRKNFTALNKTEKLLAAYGRAGHWDEVREAYKDNARALLIKIKKWLPEFMPPVIITADHGEVVGEGGPQDKGGYGHCHDQPEVKEILQYVPWFVCDEDEEILERLKGLGYV